MNLQIKETIKKMIENDLEGAWEFDNFYSKSSRYFINLGKNHIEVSYNQSSTKIQDLSLNLCRFFSNEKLHIFIVLKDLSHHTIEKILTPTQETKRIAELLYKLDNLTGKFTIENPFIHMLEIVPNIENSSLDIHSERKKIFVLNEISDVYTFNKFQKEVKEECLSIVDSLINRIKKKDEYTTYDAKKRIVTIFSQPHVLSIQKHPTFYKGSFFKMYKKENILTSINISDISNHFKLLETNILLEAKFDRSFL